MILMPRPSRALLCLAAAVPLLAGCGAGDAGGADGTAVVASFYPLEYVAERVAGEHAEVTGLVAPGQEPHDLELSFEQTAAVAEADVVLFSRGLQPAVDDAVDQSASEHVVDGSQVTEDDDPHFWLDPTRLSDVAARFAEAVTAADPEHQDAYAANLAVLRHDLQALDADL
jgi:zinc transport system substrate-binding protein